MIAPARVPSETRGSDRDARLRQARRHVAESLLGEEDQRARSAAVMAPWRAWLVCGWLLFVVVCYIATLLSGRM